MDTYKEDSHSIFQHRAVASGNCMLQGCKQLFSRKRTTLSQAAIIPETSLARRESSNSESEPTETVLYLAYGSNLSVETFRGNRGIQPISQINVQVPELRLTFDLPGVAYIEPCFANSAHRDPEDDLASSRLLSDHDDYHKNRWHKGLIGVVYEVTMADYAHIIATEGGGTSYHDILVDCYPFASSNPTQSVPQTPMTKAFKAHTLFAPAAPPGTKLPENGGRLQRPDPAYAQASARYLKLITDGATECRLPYEYQDYLHSIRPYTITTAKQRIGQFVYLSLWAPIVLSMLALGRFLADDKGVVPVWFAVMSGAIFQASWASYDSYFKETFGDGERTVAGDDSALYGVPRKRRRFFEESLGASEKGLLEV